MGNFWLKLKIWTKVIVASAALIYAILFMVFNSENQATLWFFFGSGKQVTTSVLKLVLIAFASGALFVVLVRTTFKTLGQMKELKARKATEKREKEFAELKSKAGMLRPRHESVVAESPANL